MVPVIKLEINARKAKVADDTTASILYKEIVGREANAERPIATAPRTRVNHEIGFLRTFKPLADFERRNCAAMISLRASNEFRAYGSAIHNYGSGLKYMCNVSFAVRVM